MPLPNKRRSLASVAADGDDLPSLLPGLPDHLAQLCLSLVPPSLLFSVCRSWRRLIYSPYFPPFLSLYALLCKKNTVCNSSSLSDDYEDDDDDPIGLYCFDPIAGYWSKLPPPPPKPPLRRLLIHHPSFLSRSLPIQSVATAGHLVLLAASTDDLLPALPRPLAFHPVSRRWIVGPRLRYPRRWCAAGSASGAIYLASGVGSAYSSDVARSAERWDPSCHAEASCWEPIASLRDGRFCRDAIDAVSAGGKLCMVNVLGRGVKEGVVYDVKRDLWDEMPRGLLAGWTGPVAAPTPPENGEMFVVDEVSGEVRSYNWGEDKWRLVTGATEKRRCAVVATMGAGKLCIAADGGSSVEVVDVVRPSKTWKVDLPEGMRVIALHVLPRMSEEL